MIITGELISGEFGNADIKSNIRIHCTSMHTIYNKGETIHCMYRNHDYFGDGSRYVEAAYDTMLIFGKKVVLNFRFLLLVII